MCWVPVRSQKLLHRSVNLLHFFGHTTIAHRSDEVKSVESLCADLAIGGAQPTRPSYRHFVLMHAIVRIHQIANRAFPGPDTSRSCLEVLPGIPHPECRPPPCFEVFVASPDPLRNGLHFCS